MEFKESSDGTRVRIVAMYAYIVYHNLNRATGYRQVRYSWHREGRHERDIPSIPRQTGSQLEDCQDHGERCRRRDVRPRCRREDSLPDHPTTGRDESELSFLSLNFLPLSHRRRYSSQFDEIEAKLQRRLELTYPKMRATRAKPRTPTPQRRGPPRHGGSESRTLDAW